MKITEIKVTAGKEILLLTPGSVQVIQPGKSFFLPDKLAVQLWKAITLPVEKFVGAAKELKES